MSQYLGVFLDEANEQMELLEQDILQLEQEPSQELLQEIFRAAHTLKGSSRAMGFSAMGELTHAMEDVFDKLRRDELTVHGELINALFTGLDTLKAMKDEIAESGASSLDTTEQTARLRAVLSSQTPEETQSLDVPALSAAPAETPAADFATLLSDTARMAVQDARANGFAVLGMKVKVAADCMMKSVRALMVLQALEQSGSILATTPDEDGLENEAFETEFEIVLATQAESEAIRAVAAGVSEIREVLVAPWPDAAAEIMLDTAPAPVAETEPTPAAPEPAPAPPAQDERKEDAGPEARGKAPDEVQKMAAEKKAAAQPATQTVRVDVTRLDKLLNLVGELVIDRTRIAQLGGQFEQQYAASPLIESLNETANHIGRITDELQEEIMKARMLPIDNVFNRFPRMIRDLAQKLGKEINFIVEGKETELDRSVIEVIGDPLIHMLRNSVDHGVEMPDDREAAGKPRVGTVWLRARHEENHIVIEIQDDGKGMDPEKLRANAVKKGLMTQEAANRLTDKEAIHLIFASGFSTAQTVSDISGRGVGMDIVKSNLQRLGAIIDIDSKIGVCSTFTVKLPLTLAIIQGLLVTVRGCVYALPLASVVETIKVAEESVHIVNHREVILQRGKTLPIVRLRDVFYLNAATTPAERALARRDADDASGDGRKARREPLLDAQDASDGGAASAVVAAKAEKHKQLYLVVVGLADKQIGLVVDALIGEQEVVIKTLGKFIGDIKGISGATILGDGRVALIVDVNGLISIAAEEKGRASCRLT
jgi:two-component system chemotaxis sensor kinase CheA